MVHLKKKKGGGEQMKKKLLFTMIPHECFTLNT